MKALLDYGFTVCIRTEQIAPHLGVYTVSLWKDLVRPSAETKQRKWLTVYVNDLADIEEALAPHADKLMTPIPEEFSEQDWAKISVTGRRLKP